MPVTLLDFTAGDIPTASQMDRLAQAANPYTAYTPTVTNVAVSSTSGRYQRHGDTVSCRWTITLSGAPSGTILVSLPVAASSALGPFGTVPYPSGECISVGAGNRIVGLIDLYASNNCYLVTAAGDAWNGSAPSGLVSGYIISGHLEYEAA